MRHPLTLLRILSNMASYIKFWDNAPMRQRTPQFGMSHAPRPRYRHHVPDGKWVMKRHRSRH